MTTLSSRIAAIKQAENIRKISEIRAALVEVPKRYATSSLDYVVGFKMAKTVLNQVQYVEKLFLLAKDSLETMEFLAHVLFNTIVGHPVRNKLTKLFEATDKNTSVKEIVFMSLQNCLLYMFEEFDINWNHVKWNEFIVSISACFNNFTYGLHALTVAAHKFTHLTCLAVTKFIISVRTEFVPSKRNEYYLYLQSALRSLLSCFQTFDYPYEFYATSLTSITTLCTNLAEDIDVPLEVRMNACMLLIQLCRKLKAYKTFMKYIMSVDNITELPYILCGFTVFDMDEYVNNSKIFLTISKNLIDMAYKFGATSNVLVSIARSLYQYSKGMLTMPIDMPSDAKVNGLLILRNFCLFAVTHLDHQFDTVRYQCRDMLRITLMVAKRLNFLALCNKLYKSCASLYMPLDIKCIILQQIILVFGVNSLLEHFPEFRYKVLITKLGKEPAVNSLYECIMKESHACYAFDVWKDLWINYLLEIAKCNDERLSNIELLIMRAVQIDHNILDFILISKELTLSTKLSAIWSSRKTGGLVNFNYIKKNQREFKNTLHSGNQELSLLAFRLVVETNSPSDELTRFECECIGIYIDNHMNYSDPAMRQKCHNVLKKALLRIKLALIKMHKKSKDVQQQSMSSNMQLMLLRKIMRTMVAQLFYGANYGRRWIALNILQQCVDICDDVQLKYLKFLPRVTVQRLCRLLADSYEIIKEKAVHLLKRFQDQLWPVSLIEMYKLDLKLFDILNMITSVRPLDTITGAYQLDLFCYATVIKEFMHDVHATTISDYYPMEYVMLRWCTLEIHIGLVQAKINFNRAAKHNSLYGIVFAMRHLLKKINMQQLAQHTEWRLALHDLIWLLNEVTDVMIPVLSSDSPEGFMAINVNDGDEDADVDGDLLTNAANASNLLSATVSYIDNDGFLMDAYYMLKQRLNNSNLRRIKTTPQLVLIYAWRTVKEIALFLGDIIKCAPIQLSNSNAVVNLLTKRELYFIGKHLKTLLLYVKHRGAFEQTYIGYRKLCERLWCINDIELNNMPFNWLQELLCLLDISDMSTKNNISFTRRSAGLPYMVMAIIISELQVGTTKCLQAFFNFIFKVFANQSLTCTNSRTHALNIMCVLYRCSELNEVITEYISDGVIYAISSYDALNFSERNAATSLFSALVTRIFGLKNFNLNVKQSNVKNQMTVRSFFIRYPKLYDFFANELVFACNLLEQGQQAFKLYPIFLILARLYPSPLEAAHLSFNVNLLVPLVSQCSGSSDAQIRELAAKAIAALVEKDRVITWTFDKFKVILNCAVSQKNASVIKTTQNRIHGILLQIRALLELMDPLPVDTLNTIIMHLMQIAKNYKTISSVTTKVMLDIMILLMKKINKDNEVCVLIKDIGFYAKTKYYRSIIDNCEDYPTLRNSYHVYFLHKLRLNDSPDSISQYLMQIMLSSKDVSIEILETSLNIIIILLLLHQNPNYFASITANEYSFNTEELNFVKLLGSIDSLIVTKLLYTNKDLQLEFVKISQCKNYTNDFVSKAFLGQSLLEHVTFTLPELMQCYKENGEEIKSSITTCIVRYIIDFNLSHDEYYILLEHAVDITEPSKPNFLRYKAVEMLAYLSPFCLLKINEKYLNFIDIYSRLVFALLNDQLYSIRSQAAAILVDNIGECFAEEFCQDNVEPTLAQKLFIKYLVNIFDDSSATDEMLLNIFKAITSHHIKQIDTMTEYVIANETATITPTAIDDIEVYEDNEIDIYNKSKIEANCNYEPVKIIIETSMIYRQIFSNRINLIKSLDYYEKYLNM